MTLSREMIEDLDLYPPKYLPVPLQMQWVALTLLNEWYTGNYAKHLASHQRTFPRGYFFSVPYEEGTEFGL